MDDDPQQVRNAPYITAVYNHEVVQRMPLTGPIVLGRGLDCNLWVEDAILSRHHCRIEPALEGDGWAVIDLKSRNGTFVNAKRVERAALNDGDVISIGRVHIRFHAKGYVPPRPVGPHEAVKLPANRGMMTRDADEPKRPLPKPAPRDPNAETLLPGDSGTAMKPLPFSRPAPQPKPRDEE